MSEHFDRILNRITRYSLLLAAAVCVVFWFVRIAYAISFTTPYLLSTTGFEWENLLAVWKFVEHQAVYTDPHRIPFTVSYYNWAYYWLYGAATSAVVHPLHLDAIWIPTVGRLISLVFSFAAVGLFWLTGREVVKQGFFADRPVAWAWTLIATAGPIIGFWSITVRPDIGALCFEAAGLYLILRFLRTADHRLIAAAALLFYMAWAFKQSSVTMLTGAVLALLFFKRWRAFFTLCSIWWALVIATLIAGGAVYRENVLFSQKHLPVTLSLGLTNIFRAFEKSPFLLLCLFALMVFLAKNFRRLRTDPASALLTLSFLFSFGFALLTSCKDGASDNYYIPASWIAMLGFALTLEPAGARWKQAGLIVCSALSIGAIAFSPTGRTFYISYRNQDAPHRAVAEKLRHLPGPAFVIEPYMNLPWVQRTDPHFVIPDTYYFDHAAGVPTEDGGWENLAAQGYFGTMVLDRPHISPVILRKYKQVDEYNDGYYDFKIYCRNGLAPE